MQHLYKGNKKAHPSPIIYTNMNDNIKLCQLCETQPAVKNGKTDDGTQKYQLYCSKCRYDKYRYAEWQTSPCRVRIRDTCERCDFIPEHICQLIIHHVDHDRTNDDPINLKTLCLNCHTLALYKSRK